MPDLGTVKHMPDEPVTLLTSWHLCSMRSMPRVFWNVRSLERSTRSNPACIHSHRWISRRSLLITSEWLSRSAAEDWLASEPFKKLDTYLRAVTGTKASVELYERMP